MEQLFLHLNFTGTEISDSPGLTILTPGLHSGKIAEFRYFEESSRLYVYIVTDGDMHRESFNIEQGIAFLGRFLVSAGVSSDKLSNKDIARFPIHKLTGKPVYFSYTPPEMTAEGKAVDGSYARYRFYTKERWDKLVAATQATAEDVEIETESMPTNGGDTHVEAATPSSKKKASKKKAPAKKAEPVAEESEDDDFGFLIDDE